MKHVSLFLFLMAMMLFSCKQADRYVSPSVDPLLSYSSDQAGVLDGKGFSFTIPGHSAPLVDSGGGWNTPCDVIWLDGDRIAFVDDEDRADRIHFLNVVSGKVYACEDEIQYQEVRDALRTHRLVWTRTTDRGTTGGQQMINRMQNQSKCESYDEVKMAEIKSRDESQTVFMINDKYYEARELRKIMSERVICDHRMLMQYCGIVNSRTGTELVKIGDCPGEWVTLSSDGRWLLSDAGLLDVKAKKYISKGALVGQKSSTPPVVLTYAVNPAFDKVAVVYGYLDRYVVDVADLNLPGR